MSFPFSIDLSVYSNLRKQNKDEMNMNFYFSAPCSYNTKI